MLYFLCRQCTALNSLAVGFLLRRFYPESKPLKRNFFTFRSMFGGIILSIFFVYMWIYIFQQSKKHKRLEDERLNRVVSEARILNQDLDEFAMKLAKENNKIGRIYAEIELEQGELFIHDHEPDLKKVKEIVSSHKIQLTNNKSELASLERSLIEYNTKKRVIYSVVSKKIHGLPDGKFYKYR